MVLALDRVNSDGAIYSTGQVPSVLNGVQHAMSSTVSGKPSLYGGTQGWETVRRIFNPHRGESLISTSVFQLCMVPKEILTSCTQCVYVYVLCFIFV